MAYLIEPVNIPPNNLTGEGVTFSNIVGALSCSPTFNAYYKGFDNPGITGGVEYCFVLTFQAGLLNSLTFNQFSFDITFNTLTNLQISSDQQQFVSVAPFPSNFISSCEIGSFTVQNIGPGQVSINLFVKPTTANYRFQTQFFFYLA